MERRKILFRTMLVSALIMVSGSLFAAVAPKLNPPKEHKVYSHYLLFWLKKDLSESEVKEFQNFFEGLKKLPYQKNLRYGKPANSTPRAVLDNSFTYNVYMEFDSLEDLEAYGQLPEHLALVKKYKPFFDKMMVHDTVYN